MFVFIIPSEKAADAKRICRLKTLFFYNSGVCNYIIDVNNSAFYMTSIIDFLY